MEDLRLWFLESRICRLWINIPEESWTEFLSEDGRKNRKHLMEFLEAPHNNEVFIKKDFLNIQLSLFLDFILYTFNTHGGASDRSSWFWSWWGQWFRVYQIPKDGDSGSHQTSYDLRYAKRYLRFSIMDIVLKAFLKGLHPHRMDLITVSKIRPSKVPIPTTKKDGRKEVN